MNQLADPAAVNSDERLLGLFSHLSFFFGGIILPLIFWATNKDKSRFVTFHSLQALFFHIAFVFIIVAFVFVIVFGAVGINVLALSGGKTQREFPIILMVLIFAMYASVFLAAAGGVAYSIYMAIKAYQGNLNKYPVIGKIVYKKVYGTG
jgi:uncharacterized Tic20 family protein